MMNIGHNIGYVIGGILAWMGVSVGALAMIFGAVSMQTGLAVILLNISTMLLILIFEGDE